MDLTIMFGVTTFGCWYVLALPSRDYSSRKLRFALAVLWLTLGAFLGRSVPRVTALTNDLTMSTLFVSGTMLLGAYLGKLLVDVPAYFTSRRASKAFQVVQGENNNAFESKETQPDWLHHERPLAGHSDGPQVSPEGRGINKRIPN